ncbi:6-phosphogluconate dehydrogenase (decarboxylating) [Halothiobacillus diazotrophicus]|uniref:6-phosphogluconate dehydrogenase (Decarboxylating) n=1 Tax=Halothiobacillus diazotrophicus TaxID=1860122 RepID=A0A191ZE88_9GAMM|nr:decarboxylating 6-phosphogluconate dehydrogenase [Halothiobacillus diazotrophicus]ANJ66182.1 6-phosphogluconate dehydrogenase (decarboxylating) [Halothiobacillus diazotrophicus]
MKLGIYGLGRMGANMARRLSRGGIEVVAHNRSAGPIDELVAEEANITAAYDLEQFIAALPAPRIVWLMLPAGAVTGEAIEQILPKLSPGDLLIDGGNSFYQDTLARAVQVQEAEVHYMDVGTSGGVWGLKNGYSLMVGGSKEAFALIEPAIRVLAPSADHGWGHVGPVGSGHYVKMVHNGIEYGMMQALAEGLAVLRAKKAFDLDLAQITELWRDGSVVQSWLLDLTAEALAAQGQELQHIAPVVADSGEGRWTAKEAIDLGVSAPVMTLALQMRFASQDAEGYGNRLLSLMRNAFGGHAITRK